MARSRDDERISQLIPPLSAARARVILSAFSGKRVLVVGDLMVDEHVWGSVGRISPEAPVMVVDAEDFDSMPGGAANVVTNVQALGADAGVIGAVGKDREGALLCRKMRLAGADISGVIRLPEPYRTTRKIRIWASRRQQVVRVDSESKRPHSECVYEHVTEHLERQIPEADAVVISDYNKGLVRSDVTGCAIRLAMEKGIPCLSNLKPANAGLFAGASAVTLNQSEAEAVVGVKLETRNEIEENAGKLLGTIRSQTVVVTRGSRGMSVISSDGHVHHIPAVPTEVYDVAGAGDTVISVLTLGLASGASIYESAALANLAGGAVVRKVGVATCSTDEILGMLDGTTGS